MSNLMRKTLAIQLAERINEDFIIKQNTGFKIPVEGVLATKYDVSRNTIREAIKLLVAEGILEVKQGSGTYIVDKVALSDYKEAFKDLVKFLGIKMEGDYRILLSKDGYFPFRNRNEKKLKNIKKCLEGVEVK